MLSCIAFSTSSRRRTAPCSARPDAEQPRDGRVVLAGHLARLVEVAASISAGSTCAHTRAIADAHPRERDVALDRDRGADRADEQDREHESAALRRRNLTIE